MSSLVKSRDAAAFVKFVHTVGVGFPRLSLFFSVGFIRLDSWIGINFGYGKQHGTIS